jgi:PAS domain S-box-containing protein
MPYESMTREQLLSALRELQQAAKGHAPIRDASPLLHELQMHQLELEMQNRELREAQSALKESHNRYANLYDFAPVAYCTLSQDGTIVELNLTAARMFGVPRERAQGRPLLGLAKLDQPDLLFQHLAQCAAKQAPVVTELTLSLQGRSVDVEAVSVPVLGLDQHAFLFRTALTDITRRKSAERERAQAHASEQRLRQRLQALDAAHVEVSSVLALKPEGAFEQVSEVITRHARRVLNADLATFEFAKCAETESARTTERTSVVDGFDSAVGHELRADLAYTGCCLGTLRVQRAALEQPFSEHDRETMAMFAERVASGLQIAILSAREARENARLSLLEQVSSELNRAHDHAGVKAAIVSILEGMRERFSDSALFYLLEPDKTELVHVVHREPVRVQSLSAQVGASACTEPVEALLRALTELRPRTVSASSAPVEDVPEAFRVLADALEASSLVLAPLGLRGHCFGLLCFARGPETSSFSAAEQSWIEEMASRCALSLENARLFEELRAALDWRETLLASISHDLKNPLNTISLSASALTPDDPREERRKSGRQIELIRRSAAHMDHMINDLLFEGMLSAGTFQLETGLESAAELVREARQLVEPVLQTRSQRLEQRVAAALPELRVDRERVLRVFANLIGNAAKFSPPGSLIQVRAARHPAGVAFSVADSGPGIAPAQQRQLFERYWRGNQGARGLGLGLYIAKSIVEAHGGSIWVESTPGAGATFTFTMPAAAP